jgi:type VI protein secretion system component VasK
MNPAPDHNDWLDEVERRRLGSEAVSALRQQLANRPREAARLEAELALNQLLDAQPCPRAASNFTHRVLAEIVAQESRSPARSGRRLAWLRLPRFAIYATAVAALEGGWWQFQLHKRGQLAATVSEVSQVAAIPGVAWLQDFEAIQSFRTEPQPGDVALLAALNE